MNMSRFGFIFQLALHLMIGFLVLNGAATANAANKTAHASLIEGRFVVTGSVALSNLMTYWTQAFSERHPLVSITIADPGGSAGIAALINGSAVVALISDPLSITQNESFKARFGYAPSVVPVAMDAVVVYVNDSNPLKSIDIQSLDAAFSSTYRCGGTRPIKTWGELGSKGALAQQRIDVYGLTDNTGANMLFRATALCNGDFIKDFQALAGPDAVENALIADKGGLGFSSSAMRSSGIHALAIVPQKGALAITPTATTIRSGQYPMSRILSLAINRPINQPLAPALQAFIDFVLSQEGQRIAVKAGYVALH